MYNNWDVRSKNRVDFSFSTRLFEAFIISWNYFGLHYGKMVKKAGYMGSRAMSSQKFQFKIMNGRYKSCQTLKKYKISRQITYQKMVRNLELTRKMLNSFPCSSQKCRFFASKT